ncbi:MAG: molybdopterin-binding protein [bacterium]|nr:molybdopterin-binding protein [bacterium]
MDKTISMVVIGNEVLRGKVREINASYVIEKAKELHLRVKSVHIVRDVIDDVVKALNIAAEASYVITSGGIGPTQDDLTLNAVAKFAGKKLYKSSLYIKLLKKLFKEKFNNQVEKMAYIPEGTKLILDKDGILPIMKFRNIFILPGEPSFFKRKCNECLKIIGKGNYFVKEFRLKTREELIAKKLNEFQCKYKSLFIGSYPSYEKGYVDISVEGNNKKLIEKAFKEIKNSL